MKFVLSILSLFIASTAAFAVDQPPKSLREKGSKSISTVRQFSTHSPEGTGLSYSIACHAKLVDPFFGYLSDEQFFAKKMPVNLVCYDQNDGTVNRGWTKHDAVSSNWQLNLDQEEAAQLAGAIQLYQLQAVNSSGWAVTVDDVIGDENIRRRMLRYCLVRPPKALCGEGEVGYLKDGPKAYLTEYALKILRSIEFLKDEAPSPQQSE